MALTIGGLVLLGNAIRDALEDGEKIKHRKKKGNVFGHGAARRRRPPRRASRVSPWPPSKPEPSTTWSR